MGKGAMKDKTTAYLLWLAGFVGLCGLHRFYLEKHVSGALYVATLGVCGLGQLFDIFLIGKMVEEKNRTLTEPEVLSTINPQSTAEKIQYLQTPPSQRTKNPPQQDKIVWDEAINVLKSENILQDGEDVISHFQGNVSQSEFRHLGEGAVMQTITDVTGLAFIDRMVRGLHKTTTYLVLVVATNRKVVLVIITPKGEESYENIPWNRIKIESFTDNSVSFSEIDISNILEQDELHKFLEYSESQSSKPNLAMVESIPEQIKKLSELKVQGIISEEEFQKKKSQMLDRM